MGAESSHGHNPEIRIGEISADDLSRVIAEAPPRPRFGRQLLWTIILGVVTLGATVGSIVGQGISYRQMRAIESISEALARGGCAR